MFGPVLSSSLTEPMLIDIISLLFFFDFKLPSPKAFASPFPIPEDMVFAPPLISSSSGGALFKPWCLKINSIVSLCSARIPLISSTFSFNVFYSSSTFARVIFFFSTASSSFSLAMTKNWLSSHCAAFTFSGTK